MSRIWSVLFCGAIAGSSVACSSDPVASPTDAGTVTPTDSPVAADRPAATTDGGGGGGACAPGAVTVTNMCYTEQGTAPLCPCQRYQGTPMNPSWRLTHLRVTEPAALSSALILGVINPPLREGRFLWGLNFNFTNNTFRTGPLNPMFTRGTLGAQLMDATYSFYNNDAPTTGGAMANRWNPATGAITGTTTVSTGDQMAQVNLPIFNADGSVLVELPLANARLLDVPVSADRGCIGAGLVRAGRYNECSSEWETEAGGTVSAAITISAARSITVSALNQTLCQLLAGTDCAMPMPMWRNQPNTMVGTEPAYRLTAKFAGISANIR